MEMLVDCSSRASKAARRGVVLALPVGFQRRVASGKTTKGLRREGRSNKRCHRALSTGEPMTRRVAGAVR